MMKNLFDSDIKNDKNGQLWMSYYPNMVKPGKYTCDCISAGSISLMIQSIIPSMMFCNKETIFIMKVRFNYFIFLSIFNKLEWNKCK